MTITSKKRRKTKRYSHIAFFSVALAFYVILSSLTYMQYRKSLVPEPSFATFATLDKNNTVGNKYNTTSIDRHSDGANVGISKLSLANNNSTSSSTVSTHRCNIGNEIVSLPKIFPHFIIVGAQKAGTTALSYLLDRIPTLLASKKARFWEPHFWDNSTIGNPQQWSSDERCRHLKNYFKNWNATDVKPNSILFEKTPILLALPEVPNKIITALSHKPKIIIILRDPIARAYSQYKMAWLRFHRKKAKGRVNGTFASFELEVMLNANDLVTTGVMKAPSFTNYSTDWNLEDFTIVGKPTVNYVGMIERGFYAQQIRYYMEHFPLDESLKVISYEAFLRNKTGVLNELSRFIGGPYHNFSDENVTQNLSPLAHSQQTLQSVCPPPSNESKAYLKHLYKPYNDELVYLLGESWRGIWD